MNSQPTIQLLYISNEKCHFIDREKKKKCGTKLIVLSNQSTVAFARKNN